MTFQDVVLTMDIRTLVDNPFQYRKDYTDLESLSQSIASQGLLQMPVVRLKPEHRTRLKKEASYQKRLEKLASGSDPAFEIAFGHRRIRALLELAKSDESYFSCQLLVRDLSDQEMLEIALTENIQRTDIHPYHIASRVAEMVKAEKGATGAVAKKLGKTHRWVLEHLRYLELPELAVDLWLSDVLQQKHISVLIKYPVEFQLQALDDLIDCETQWNEETEEREVVGYYCHRTAKEFEQYFQRNVQINLEQAKFDVYDKELVEGVSDCISCPFNTCNQATLFPEITAKAGVCTNPGCFTQKSVKVLMDKVQAIREQGHTVSLIDSRWSPASYLQNSLHPLGEEVLGRDDFSTNLETSDGRKIAPQAIGVFCDWLHPEAFLDQYPIVLKGDHKEAADPTMETWLSGHKRKVHNREIRREKQVAKEKQQVRIELAHRLAELKSPDAPSSSQTDMLLGILFTWVSSKVIEEFIGFVKKNWVMTNQLESDNLPAADQWKYLRIEGWKQLLNAEQKQKAIRFFLLMGAAEYESDLGNYLLQAVDESGQEGIIEEIEQNLESERMTIWNEQDAKVELEMKRFHERMQKIAALDENEDSWFSKTVKTGNWEELETLQKIEPKFIRKMARTLGIKLKTGASDEDVITTFKNYRDIVLEELTSWKEEFSVQS